MWGITSKIRFGVSKKFHIKLEERRQRLYRMVFAWCHDPHLSVDLTQEALQKARKKNIQPTDDESLDVRLFTILADCWRDHCLHHNGRVDINEVILTDPAGPEHGGRDMMVINRVHRAMSQLKQDQRQIVSLVDLEGMSYNHVAQVLDISIETVMNRLCQARRHLVEQLHDVSNELVHQLPATLCQMKDDDSISDEQLNSLVDNELADEERAIVLDAIQNDKVISVCYYALQQIVDLVTLAYQDPVTPIQSRHLSPGSKSIGWIHTAQALLSKLLH